MLFFAIGQGLNPFRIFSQGSFMTALRGGYMLLASTFIVATCSLLYDSAVELGYNVTIWCSKHRTIGLLNDTWLSAKLVEYIVAVYTIILRIYIFPWQGNIRTYNANVFLLLYPLQRGVYFYLSSTNPLNDKDARTKRLPFYIQFTHKRVQKAANLLFS